MKLLILTAFLFLGSAVAVNAALLTFEGQNNTIYSAPITRSGFDIGNPVAQEQHFHEIISTQFGLPNNGTGVLLNDRNTQISLRSSALLDFGLSSVDVAAFNAISLTIYGYNNGSLTGSINIASLGSGYTNVIGSSLGTVDYLLFDGFGGDGGFVLDNVTLNEGNNAPVPEPGTMMLLGLGIAGLAVYGKGRVTKLAA